MSFNGNAFHGTNRRICDLLGRAERSFALAKKEAKTANPPSKLGTCLNPLLASRLSSFVEKHT